MKLTPTVIQAILRAVFATQPAAIGCDECYARLDQFAELHLAGKDAGAALPLVKAHLDHCRDCREEFETLLAVLHEISN